MAKHIISTLTADVRYAQFVTQPGVSTLVRAVTVKGGAGVASAGSGQVVTPAGVRTEVSDEDAEFLLQHGQFLDHQKRGHVKIINKPTDPNTVAQKMEKDGGSAPKTPADVAKAAKMADKGDGTPPLQAVVNASK